MASTANLSAQATAADLELYLGTVSDLHVISLSTAAAVTWLAYDILSTLEREAEVIWRAKWTIPKVLYFVIRYNTLLSLLGTLVVDSRTELSTTFCRRWFWYSSFNGTLLASMVGDSMFVMRLCASYAQMKPVVVFVVALYIGQVVMGLVLTGFTLSTVRIVPQDPTMALPGCLFTNPEHRDMFIAAWILGLCAATIYFALILFKFMHNITLKKHPQASAVPIQELRIVSPLIYSFIRDSAIYFFLIFVGHLINLIFEVVFFGRALIEMSTVWLAAIYSVSASRLCLSTRESLQRRRFEYDTGWFEDIELDDQLTAPNGHGPLFAGAHGQGSWARNGSAFVVQGGRNVSLQRNTFESDSPRAVEPTNIVLDKRSRQSAEEDELMSVAPWIILER